MSISFQIQTISLILSVAIFLSCNKEPSALDVPALSYSINGDTINEIAPFGYSNFDRTPDYLVCYVYLGEYSEFQFILSDPQVGTYPADETSFNDILIVHQNFLYTSHGFSNNSTITITELNEYYGRVSGSFIFTGVNQENPLDTLIITDGKFENFYYAQITGAESDLGKMHFKLNAKEVNFFSVYDFSETEGLMTPYGAYNYYSTIIDYKRLQITSLPEATGSYMAGGDINPSYAETIDDDFIYYGNLLPGSEINVTQGNTEEGYSEIEFNFSLTNDTGDTVHITEGYAKVYN